MSESRINPPDSQSEPPSWFVVAKADRLQHSCDRGECLLLFLFSGFVPSLSSRFACVPCDLRFAMLFVVLEEQLQTAYLEPISTTSVLVALTFKRLIKAKLLQFVMSHQ